VKLLRSPQLALLLTLGWMGPASPSILAASQDAPAPAFDRRPWFHLEGGFQTDDQPLQSQSIGGKVGRYLTPQSVLELSGSRALYTLETGKEEILPVEIRYLEWWESGAMVEGRMGAVHALDRWIWTGQVGVGTTFGKGWKGRVEWNRALSLHTEASLREPVVPHTARALLTLDQDGWLGEIGAAQESYPDQNLKRQLFFWLTAPLLQLPSAQLGLGYAGSAQDSRQSRFTPVKKTPGGGVGPPVWEGRYAPYYTPLEWRTHSVTGYGWLDLLPGLQVSLNGRWTALGRELRPVLLSIGAPGGSPAEGDRPQVAFAPADIHPWEVRLGLRLGLSSRTALHAEGRHLSHPWYDATAFHLSLRHQ